MKKRYLVIGIIIFVAIILVFSLVTLSNNSRNAARSSPENCVSLFTAAYGVLMENLSEANLLPQFDTAEVVEEHLYGSLNEEELLAFVNKLNEIYPYTITISRGHDRLEGPHTQIPYEERDFIFVFLVGYFNDNINRQFNMVKVEGFVNDNTHPVIMYFRFSSKEWKLMKMELLSSERDRDNQQEASSPNTYLPQIKIDGTVYYLEGNENPGIEIAESDYLGEVLSTVPLSQQVAENGQANFNVGIGAPYAKYGDGIVVLWNDKWTLFVEIIENNT